MSRASFTLLRVEQHGRRVAVIFDNATGKTYKVHRRGSRFHHWNKSDQRVETQGLRGRGEGSVGVKLSKGEKAVLRLTQRGRGEITAKAVLATGLKTTAVCERLVAKDLIKKEPWSQPPKWHATKRGRLVLRIYNEKRPCDWCGDQATDGREIHGSATNVYFCDDHARIGVESAEGARSLTEGNLGNKVFGKAAVERATREAALA